MNLIKQKPGAGNTDVAMDKHNINHVIIYL
jgi:hypothetical protein